MFFQSKDLIVFIIILFIIFCFPVGGKKNTSESKKLKKENFLRYCDYPSYMSCIKDNDSIHVSKFVSLGKNIYMSVYLVNGDVVKFISDTTCSDSLIFSFNKKYLKTKKTKFKDNVKVFDCSLNIDCVKTIQVTRKDFYDF